MKVALEGFKKHKGILRGDNVAGFLRTTEIANAFLRIGNDCSHFDRKRRSNSVPMLIESDLVAQHIGAVLQHKSYDDA